MNAPADSAVIRAAWRRHALLWLGLILLQAVVFRDTWSALFEVWSQSATYNHCFLIIPIVGWLVWQRRSVFETVMPQVSWPGVALLVLPSLLWSLGHLAGIRLFEHVAIVAFLQISVMVAFGWSGLRALLFPVAYLAFLAPIGDQLTQPLQSLTARFSVWALLKLDIPTFSDGVFIQIPSGDFEVAEACAGVRFLIATIALAVLYANIAFKSWPRRIIVIGMACIVPVIANAIRALGIILIAHWSDMKYAVGADHIIYGWGFFAAITVLLLLISRPFADRPISEDLFDPAPLASENRPVADHRKAALAVVAGAAVLLACFGYNRFMDLRAPDRVVVDATAPAVPGWELLAGPRDWQATYVEPDMSRQFTYRRGADVVDVHIVAYNRESSERELIAQGQGAVPPQSEDMTVVQWRWMRDGEPAQLNGSRIETHTMTIRQGGLMRNVWQWYWQGGKRAGLPSRSKVNGLIARATGADMLAASVLVSAPQGTNAPSSWPMMQAFLDAAGGPDALLNGSLRFAPRQQD